VSKKGQLEGRKFWGSFPSGQGGGEKEKRKGGRKVLPYVIYEVVRKGEEQLRFLELGKKDEGKQV